MRKALKFKRGGAVDKARAARDKADVEAKFGGADAPLKAPDVTAGALDKPAAKVSASKGPSFREAFAAARKEKGANGTFTWNGKSFSTARGDDAPAKKAAPAKAAPAKAAPAKAAPAKAAPAKAAPAKRPVEGTSPDIVVSRDRPAKAAAPVKKPTSPDKVSGGDIAKIVSLAGGRPASTPARGGDTDSFGSPRVLSAAQRQMQADAKSRASAAWKAAGDTIKRDASMSEADKVKARMRAHGTPGYAKGGKIDGCAQRGRTKTKRT